jgi:hypothetical protein
MIEINYSPANVHFLLEEDTTTLSDGIQESRNEMRHQMQVQVQAESAPLQLTVRLIRATEQQIGSVTRNDCKYYAVFQILHNGRIIRCVQWQHHKLLMVNLNASVELKSYQMIGFP